MGYTVWVSYHSDLKLYNAESERVSPEVKDLGSSASSWLFRYNSRQVTYHLYYSDFLLQNGIKCVYHVIWENTISLHKLCGDY